MSIKLSLIDLSTLPYNGGRRQAYANTIETAQHIEKLGYHRIWLAEHHSAMNVVGRAPEVMIPAVAANTSKIRVGSGAVLLNHYSPFKVAELYGSMEELFPRRIDLGIGRATTGPITDVALQRNRSYRQTTDDSMEQLVELLTWYDDDWPSDHPFARAKVFRDEAPPNAFLLGSSSWSAQAGARVGLPYVFASFINPAQTHHNIQLYRQHFQKSTHIQGVDKPSVILSLNIYCQDTEEDALAFVAPTRVMMQRLRQGDINSPIVSESEAVKMLGQGNIVERMESPEYLPRYFIGDPETLKSEITEVAEFYKVDEIMIQLISADHKRRLHSLELLAEMFLK